MWEFCLYFEKEQLSYIINLKKHLQRFFKKYRGVVVLYEEDCKVFIGLEGNEKVFIEVYRYIYNYIISTIYTYYKRKTLNKLTYLNFNNDIFEFIIKETLFCFDEEYDKNLISEKLILNKSLNLEGFYNFKLFNLKEKWEQLISLIQNNKQILNNYIVSLELIRYLLSELENKIDKVCLFTDGKKFFLKTTTNENLNYKKINFSKKQGFKEIIKNLIKLSPKSIILCSEMKNKDFQLFKDIFIDKLT